MHLLTSPIGSRVPLAVDQRAVPAAVLPAAATRPLMEGSVQPLKMNSFSASMTLRAHSAAFSVSRLEWARRSSLDISNPLPILMMGTLGSAHCVSPEIVFVEGLSSPDILHW